MKKGIRNWYVFFISFLIIWIILGWAYYLWNVPLPSIPLVFGMAASLALFQAILLQMKYIDFPDYIKGQRVCDDETIERKYHVILDSTTAILFYLSGALSWYLHYEILQFSILLNAVLIIRPISAHFINWVLKCKQQN